MQWWYLTSFEIQSPYVIMNPVCLFTFASYYWMASKDIQNFIVQSQLASTSTSRLLCFSFYILPKQALWIKLPDIIVIPANKASIFKNVLYVYRCLSIASTVSCHDADLTDDCSYNPLYIVSCHRNESWNLCVCAGIPFALQSLQS